MPKPNAILQQINRLVAHLVEIGVASDQNCAFVREGQQNLVEVTFPKAEHVSIALKDRAYKHIYDHLAFERAFVLRLPDGALVQMRYLFDGELLRQHSLGFFPSPYLDEFQNNPEIYLEDAIYAEVVARNIVSFPIRFDYDLREQVHKPVDHPKSHMTLGQYENCRIPVSSPITPYWFIAFLLRNFYHTAFIQYVDDLPKFVECYDESILPEERQILFLQIPAARKA